MGPPRFGKTAGYIIPQLVLWGGSAISTSVKPDVLRATAGRREQLARLHGGRIYVYAPTIDGVVEGIRPMRWSPLVGCADPEVAGKRAQALIDAASTGEGMKDANHWRTSAHKVLRPLFVAASNHPQHPGDLALVHYWLATKVDEPLMLLRGLQTFEGDLMADELAGVMLGTANTERAGIVSTARVALHSTASPSVLRSCSNTDFDAEEFLTSCSTLYIVSPTNDQKAVAPLLALLIGELVATAFRLHAEGRLPLRLLLSLDEVANIAPLPNLSSILSQGSGQGVTVSWAAQSMAQLRHRYGEHEAEAIFSSTAAKLIWGGLSDGPFLSRLSELIGDHQVSTKSRTKGPDGKVHTTHAHEWRRWLTPAQIHGIKKGWALLVHNDAKPYMVRLPVAAKRRAFRALLNQPWSLHVDVGAEQATEHTGEDGAARSRVA